MSNGLVEALRERVHSRSILIGAGVLAVLHVVFDASLAQLATTAVTGAILGLSEAAEDAYDLQSEVRSLGFGSVVTVSGVALLTLDEGDTWLPVAFLILGAWFLLDAVQTLRHDGLREDDDVPDGTAVYRTYVARRVHEALGERPRTRRELSEALDMDDEDVDRALDALREKGLLDRRGSEFHVSSSEQTKRAVAREKLGSGAKRVLRPVTLELAEE